MVQTNRNLVSALDAVPFFVVLGQREEDKKGVILMHKHNRFCANLDTLALQAFIRPATPCGPPAFPGHPNGMRWPGSGTRITPKSVKGEPSRFC